MAEAAARFVADGAFFLVRIARMRRAEVSVEVVETEAHRSWRSTGLPSRTVAIGWPRWRPGPLLVGLAVSVLVHEAFETFLRSIPWSFFGGNGANTGILAGIGSTGLAACVLLTLGKERSTRPRHEPWALTSAWLCAGALLFGWGALDEAAGNLFWEDGLSSRAETTVQVVLALFAASWAAAVVAAVRMRAAPARGWTLVIWGLVVPLWFGGLIARFVLYPLVFEEPTRLERTLPEVRGARFPDLDPRRFVPSLVVEPDGRLRHGTETLDEASLPQVLARWAGMMPTKIDPDFEGSRYPDDPVRLFAPADVEFERVDRLLREIAGSGIWKVEVAVRRTRRPWLGAVRLYLPRDTGSARPPRPFSVRIDAVPGPPRRLRYTVHERTADDADRFQQLLLSENAFGISPIVGPGVTWGEYLEAFFLKTFDSLYWVPD